MRCLNSNASRDLKVAPGLIRILIVLILLSSQVKANSQTRVSLHFKKGSLESVLKEVRKQTGYLFGLQDQWKQMAKPIDISVDNATLEEALSLCFKNQPFDYAIINKTIIIREKAPAINTSPGDTVHASKIDVRGIVLDDKKQPAVGVSVALKGTNRVTTTDDDGSFFVPGVNSDATLIFSSVNLETFSLRVQGKSDIVIQLKTKTTELGEVAVEVNTGYQHVPRERATGSFDFVDNNTINQQVGSNILDRLNGVASGVLFVNNQSLQGGPSNGVMIRGLSTINGLKAPLIIVDNFPYDGNLSNINPNDVESFTVLKDASAASIWGVRAGNGVIVITLKKGKHSRKLQVGASAGIISTGRPALKDMRIIPPSDYIDLEKLLFTKGIYNVYDDVGPRVKIFPAFSPVIEALLAQRRGAISADSAQAIINHYKSEDIRDQYAKYIYQRATTQQYNVNLQGGTEALAYYFSAGYDKNITQLGQVSERYTFRSDNTYKITNHLEINTNVQYTQTNSSTGKPAYGTITLNNMQIPYLQFADQYGNPTPVAYLLRKPYTDTAGAGKLLDWNYYPLTDWKHSYSKSKLEDILANINLNYKLIKGLSASVHYMFESQHNSVNNINDLSSYYTRNLVNQFTQINSTSGAVKYVVPLGGILNHNDSKIETNNIRGQFTFGNTFQLHRIDAIVGAELRETRTYSTSSLYYGYNDNTLTTIPVDLVNAYPSYVNGRTSTIPYPQSPLQEQLNRYVSLYANASYAFKDRYIASASARKDGSNLFGVTSNNRWNPLWSIGGSWVLSKEPFYRLQAFPFLKIRATYGYSGNTNPALAAVLTLRTVNSGYPTFLNISQITNFPNPGLKWERNQMANLGIDFKSKDAIVQGSIEGYLKKGVDLYGPSPVDPTTGLNEAQSITKNIANMKGKGIDVSLTFKLVDAKFKWNINSLYSYNESKASQYNLDTTLLGNQFISTGATVNPIVGRDLYSIVAFKWAGLDNQGNPQGYLDGKLSEDYVSIITTTRKEDLIYKPALPKHFGSFINTFSYIGFSMSINISFRLGYYFMKPTVNYASLIGSGANIGTSDYEKRWQNPGDEAKTSVPSFIYPDNQYRDAFYTESSINITKADNVKLQYVNFGYDFSKIARTIGFVKGCFVYINASNLGILWRANHDKIDPDYYLNTPVPGKTYSVGLRTTF